MSKERLEEIKRKFDLDRIRKFVDTNLISPQDLIYLIQQAERVQELEEELYGNNIQMGYKQMYSECNRDYAKLRHQNKRYREALEEIYELAEYNEYDNTLGQIVSEVEKALEESK